MDPQIKLSPLIGKTITSIEGAREKQHGNRD